jgi:hypothetical protein
MIQLMPLGGASGSYLVLASYSQTRIIVRFQRTAFVLKVTIKVPSFLSSVNPCHEKFWYAEEGRFPCCEISVVFGLFATLKALGDLGHC